MSEATETTQEEAGETAPRHAGTAAARDEAAPHEKAHSVLVQAAGVGLAMLGSSTAGNVVAGNIVSHADHGHSVARWTGALLSMLGFLVGGILFPFAMVPAAIVAGAFQILALVAVVALNAAGFGRPDAWAELKAQAAAERAQRAAA